jgi:DNA-binding FrmR family transcriptional regulator
VPTRAGASATISGIPCGGILSLSEHGWWQMPGYTGDKEQVLTRLRRIEGQVRGLQRLVDQDAYCIDVLTQISAVDKALKGVAINLLDGHLRHCVRDGVAAGGRDAEAIVTEATDAIARLVRA